MALPAIVAQPAIPAPSNPGLSALAAALTHAHAADPAYGIPFSRALGRAVEHAERGIAYEPSPTTPYRVQSGTRAWRWYDVTPEQCSCGARGPWCWHRAFIHLLIAGEVRRHRLHHADQTQGTAIAADAGGEPGAIYPLPLPAVGSAYGLGLTEALAPYLNLPALRRLVGADVTRINEAMTGAELPAGVLALLDALSALLRPTPREQITGPADVAALLMVEMGQLVQEHFRVICLDSKNHVQALTTLYQGNVSSASIRIAEVFREPIRRNSAAILIAHNHPSGDPSPSPEDVAVTREIVAAGTLLGIDVLDHLIIGQGRWLSLRERRFGFDG